MTENTDTYTKAYVKEGWASLGFDLYDDYDSNYESQASYGGDGEYFYTNHDMEENPAGAVPAFYKKGGFVEVLDI